MELVWGRGRKKKRGKKLATTGNQINLTTTTSQRTKKSKNQLE